MVDLRKVDLKVVARKVMEQYGFEAVFPANLMAEVGALEDQAQKAEPDVRDLRSLLWSSIDNSDSEDLDQIEYCKGVKSGEILVKVAIADVDMYVPEGSFADEHARRNTTSVYTGIETYPMLPDRLSKGLSSLLPEQERLAVVVEFSVLPGGEVLPRGIYKALVRNKAKLIYEEVGAWLEGSGPLPETVGSVLGLDAQLRLQDEASQRLEGYRVEQGALELETLEVRAILKQGKVSDLVVIHENRAMQIIENFMVAANGVMSGFLEKARIPTIQRVVRIPKDWNGVVEVAKARGASLPAKPDAKALSEFLASQKKADPELFPDLSLTIVKLLGSGEYVMYDSFQPRIGHFCLAVRDYTHGTAPNRRYVDVVIQRLLKAALERVPSPYGSKELSKIAAWCTEREGASKKVERFMEKAEAAFVLSGKIGQSFNSIVTGVSDHGTYVRLIAPPAEGRVMRGVRGLRVGQKVVVKLINLNPNRGFIDFEVAGWKGKRQKRSGGRGSRNWKHKRR
ncbi:MAG: Ribonuclease R [Candidatus Fermentimicrarchaeum limneticum]|uniref:Ribonuclease R n=1 Tax=Fermentimicrarchaeum limneticum TaxID=2795018 RepID=A0A7D6BC41_FERL1|nr:MAG: Ribonuclease R [Candidatus Fermentimicrarchaeum limneticum]